MKKLPNRTIFIISLIIVAALFVYASNRLFFYCEFCFNPAEQTIGTYITHSKTRHNTRIYYNYFVNGNEIKGEFSNIFPIKDDNIQNKYTIRYLANDLEKSVIMEYFFFNLILTSLAVILFLFSLLFYILGLIKKLPTEIQERFNKLMS